LINGAAIFPLGTNEGPNKSEVGFRTTASISTGPVKRLGANVTSVEPREEAERINRIVGVEILSEVGMKSAVTTAAPTVRIGS